MGPHIFPCLLLLPLLHSLCWFASQNALTPLQLPEEGFRPIERGSDESEDEDSDEERRLSGAAASSSEAATQVRVACTTAALATILSLGSHAVDGKLHL